MDKLREYIKLNGYSTSEDVFYINEQPKNTCPMLDELKDGINKALRELSYNEDIDDIKYWVEYYLANLDLVVEQARENTENIREWGQQWKDLAKRVINKTDIEIEDIY